MLDAPLGHRSEVVVNYFLRLGRYFSVEVRPAWSITIRNSEDILASFVPFIAYSDGT